MTELEKLGYIKSEDSSYIEWNNYKEDVRLSFHKATKTFYIRRIEKRRPTTIFPKELMALLIDTGYADLVKG